MNYEEAFRHYREGTATDEEKAFVLDELAKAKALSSLLDDEGLAVKRAPIKEAEAKDVKEAKHDLVWKRVLAGLIAIAVIVVVIGAVLGGVFGAAAAYGKDNILLDRAEAIAVYTPDRVITDLPQDVEDKFNFETDLKSSYYSYEVDVTVWTAEGYELDYEVVVNAHTGSPSLKEREGTLRPTTSPVPHSGAGNKKSRATKCAGFFTPQSVLAALWYFAGTPTFTPREKSEIFPAPPF